MENVFRNLFLNRMENENKDKNIILTDEELKEVAGGVSGSRFEENPCAWRNTPIACKQHKGCMWTGSECTVRPNS